jgi:hypothetical protein
MNDKDERVVRGVRKEIEEIVSQMRDRKVAEMPEDNWRKRREGKKGSVERREGP